LFPLQLPPARLPVDRGRTAALPPVPASMCRRRRVAADRSLTARVRARSFFAGRDRSRCRSSTCARRRRSWRWRRSKRRTGGRSWRRACCPRHRCGEVLVETLQWTWMGGLVWWRMGGGTRTACSRVVLMMHAAAAARGVERCVEYFFNLFLCTMRSTSSRSMVWFFVAHEVPVVGYASLTRKGCGVVCVVPDCFALPSSRFLRRSRFC
jgi:hypothetical protein